MGKQLQGQNWIQAGIILVLLGVLANTLSNFIPLINPVFLALLLGLILSNVLSFPGGLSSGIVSIHKMFLHGGIILLGAAVEVQDLLVLGPGLLIMVVLFLLLSCAVMEILARVFGLEPKLGSCLAAGFSVCGVSAVVATGGAIDARERHIAYAVATVLLFDVVTVFALPLLGEVLKLEEMVYGVWAGMSMLSTGTAVAAGFAYGETAGQMASIIKVARNVFIGVWALVYALHYSRGESAGVTGKHLFIACLWQQFPRFILGFLALLLAVHILEFPSIVLAGLGTLREWLFIAAFAGLGYSLHIKDMRGTGWKPVLAFLLAFLLISSSILLTALFLL